jgi:hypothetical protein
MSSAMGKHMPEDKGHILTRIGKAILLHANSKLYCVSEMARNIIWLCRV